jgi:hypothetical protein
MSLAAAGRVTGWLWIGPESRLSNSGQLTVRFRDVAVGDYHSIGDVVIATPLC